MKTILITGATGLIGKEIVRFCHQNQWVVHFLTTSKQKLKHEHNYKGFYWNPDENVIDSACFVGVDTIINLVGAPISNRWTTSYKNTIISSRIDTAKLLLDTIKAHQFSIDHVISASAIGLYPSSQTKYYDEELTNSSKSFLGTVVQKWEEAIDQFKDIGVKVSKVRIGLVLSEKGGALTEIIKPMQFGLGAAFGSGEQWQSWIHIEDLARLFVFIAENNLEGVYNGVAPNPVSNSELTKTAAKVLKKPLILPNIPKFMMKLILGEMHILLFESQRVSSSKVESKGFDFQFHHLEPALEDLLN